VVTITNEDARLRSRSVHKTCLGGRLVLLTERVERREPPEMSEHILDVPRMDAGPPERGRSDDVFYGDRMLRATRLLGPLVPTPTALRTPTETLLWLTAVKM
jgi:hypothetical protein